MLTEKFGKNFNPLVSIIIPVYNGSNYVSEAIDSALAQTYKNIEIIVVNDGSTDNTEEIVKSYGNKLKYFRKKNGGVSSALNLAIRKSKGEYISWLSHDDMYYSDKIEKQVGVLRGLGEKKRGKTILYGNYSLIDEESRKVDEFRIENRYDIKKLNYPLYPILNCIVNGCTLLIPKKCFDSVGLFDEELRTTQDYDMWLRMFPSYDLKFVPHIFVKFRIHEKQGSKVITVVKREQDMFWLKVYRGISDEEKVLIDGSLEVFYKKRLRFAKSMGLSNSEKYLVSAGGKTANFEELYVEITGRVVNKLRRIFFRVFQ